MNDTNLEWEKPTEEKFKLLIGKMPVFLSGLAEQKVSQKAQSLAKEANHALINEKDMVDAFFSETPFGFQGLMKNDLNSIGID